MNMKNNPLPFGIIGFMLGGLLVAVAATTFDKQDSATSSEMSMSSMTADLKTKTGDEYDKAFVAYMMEHHQSAVDMAKLSASRSKHDEVKTLSTAIVSAQESEIAQMIKWQTQWGYMDHSSMNMMNHN